MITVSGSTSPYAYTWNNGSTSNSLSNLSAGIDSVTVSDANNCSVIQYDTVTEPAALILGAPTITDIGCKGGNTGEIIANPGGGTAPYSYAWIEQSNNMTFTGDTISNLAADNYGLEVTDANGCTAVATYPITTIPPLLFTPSSTNITCAGYANGTALVTLTSGTPPFSYEWSGNGMADDSTMTGIPPEAVSVVVTDANNCTGYAGFLITEPQQIYVADTVPPTNVSCNGGSNGRIVDICIRGHGHVIAVMEQWPRGLYRFEPGSRYIHHNSNRFEPVHSQPDRYHYPAGSHKHRDGLAGSTLLRRLRRICVGDTGRRNRAV